MNKKMEQHEVKSYVSVNGELVSMNLVEFVNIEEDFHGIDLVTFVYKGEKLQSYIILK